MNENTFWGLILFVLIPLLVLGLGIALFVSISREVIRSMSDRRGETRTELTGKAYKRSLANCRTGFHS